MNNALSLSLQKILPRPLRERLTARASDVWQEDLIWRNTEQIFIRAPSGVGKTTLIHILYGLRTDYEGTIVWGSEQLSQMDPERISDMRRREVSIMFQDMRLFPALTAWENLEIKRVLTHTVSMEQVKSWMNKLGIADRADRPAATLSYGEQQRVAILRALLQPFKWLLMDEPFSHLDHANTTSAAELIEAVVAQNGASLILADLDDNRHFSYSQKLML